VQVSVIIFFSLKSLTVPVLSELLQTVFEWAYALLIIITQ